MSVAAIKSILAPADAELLMSNELGLVRDVIYLVEVNDTPS